MKAERKLKESGDLQGDEAFRKLKLKHSNNYALFQIPDESLAVFRSKLPNGLPPPREVDHRIELVEGARLPFQSLYHFSPTELVASKEYIQENLASGKIRASKSPYCSPLFFAKEKDGYSQGCRRLSGSKPNHQQE